MPIVTATTTPSTISKNNFYYADRVRSHNFELNNTIMEIRNTAADQYGNYFITQRTPTTIHIQLKLANENRVRNVGIVNRHGRFIEIVRDKARHLFRKGNAYGFNEHLIKTGKTFDSVKLIDDDGVYVFPKTLILEKGQYLFFKEQGFERQLFLNMDVIRQYAVDERI